MTPDEIAQIARQAGFDIKPRFHHDSRLMSLLTRFAGGVAKAERERMAQVAENAKSLNGMLAICDPETVGHDRGVKAAADAIRRIDQQPAEKAWDTSWLRSQQNTTPRP